MKRLFINNHLCLKTLIILGLIFSVVVFGGCNRQQTDTEVAAIQPGLPPSLTPDQGIIRVSLSEKEVAELNIRTIEVKSNFEGFTVSGPAKISIAPGYAQVISAPIQGKVQKIFFSAGDVIKAGDVLFQIESIEFGDMIAVYLRALASAEFEKSQMERIEQLVEKRITPQNELDKIRSDFRLANAEVLAARAKLRTVGLTPKEIDYLANTEGLDPFLKVKSPITGKIDQLDLEPGQAVEAYEFMARIINSSKLLVTAYLSPSDGAVVKTGDFMKLLTPAMNANEKVVAIHAINPGVDESSRSVVAHATFDNPDGQLWPGENIRVVIETHAEHEMVSIPIAAVTYDGDFPIVFVKITDRVFEKRIIKISQLRNDRALLEGGLSPGEQVAVSQIFSLKALMRFDLFSE